MTLNFRAVINRRIETRLEIGRWQRLVTGTCYLFVFTLIMICAGVLAKSTGVIGRILWVAVFGALITYLAAVLLRRLLERARPPTTVSYENGRIIVLGDLENREDLKRHDLFFEPLSFSGRFLSPWPRPVKVTAAIASVGAYFLIVTLFGQLNIPGGVGGTVVRAVLAVGFGSLLVGTLWCEELRVTPGCLEVYRYWAMCERRLVDRCNLRRCKIIASTGRRLVQIDDNGRRVSFWTGVVSNRKECLYWILVGARSSHTPPESEKGSESERGSESG